MVPKVGGSNPLIHLPAVVDSPSEVLSWVLPIGTLMKTRRSSNAASETVVGIVHDSTIMPLVDANLTGLLEGNDPGAAFTSTTVHVQSYSSRLTPP